MGCFRLDHRAFSLFLYTASLAWRRIMHDENESGLLVSLFLVCVSIKVHTHHDLPAYFPIFVASSHHEVSYNL